MIAHVTTKHFRTQLEPTFSLPAQCCDGAAVEVRICIGVGVFVFNLLADEDGKLGGVLCHQTREDHVGKVVVALGISIFIVGDAVTIVIRVVNNLGRDILAQVVAVVTEQTDRYWGNIPSVVGVVEPSLQLGGVVGRHLIQTIHFGDDALTGAVVFQLVGIFGPGIVVRRDDKVLGTVFIAAKPFLHTSGIVNDGQLIVVHQLGCKDRIPVGRTQTVLTKMACTAFKINGKLNVGVDNQVFCDRVVLERCDGYRNRLNATDVGAAHGERLDGIEGVLAVNGHVFHIVHVGLFSLRLNAKCGGDVHIV